MDHRTRWGTAVLAGLGMIGLAAALVQCEGWEEPVTPTRTREEELLIERQHFSSQSASSADECTEILKTEPWCSVIKTVERITRPEWEELFPQTDFYLVSYDLHGGVSVQEKNALIVEQNGCYTAETFDFLLAANGITTVTDENRELVARAFVLMALDEDRMCHCYPPLRLTALSLQPIMPGTAFQEDDDETQTAATQSTATQAAVTQAASAPARLCAGHRRGRRLLASRARRGAGDTR